MVELLVLFHSNERSERFPAHVAVSEPAPQPYARAGDAAKARTAYQDFFVLWKDADPDLPILISAKSEYAKLT
jgi:hypothetical protein